MYICPQCSKHHNQAYGIIQQQIATCSRDCEIAWKQRTIQSRLDILTIYKEYKR